MQTATLFNRMEVGDLIAAAENHPHADAALKVRAWSLRLAAKPGKRVEIAQELFDHFKNSPSPALRLEAARWLNQRGMHRLALDIAEPSKIESEDWLMLYLDAVAALGDWEQVFHTLTAAGDLPLPPAVRKLFELRVALKTGRQPDLTESLAQHPGLRTHGIRREPALRRRLCGTNRVSIRSRADLPAVARPG